MEMKDRSKLSERQRNILRFMEAYIENNGFPPTIREIGEATDINSTSVVNYNLNKLVQAGFLTRVSSKSRGLRLVEHEQRRQMQVLAAAKIVNIPVVGKIVAGEPVAVPPADEYAADGNVFEVTEGLIGSIDPSEVFALQVHGDSMIDAMIDEGDIILLRRQQTAKDGDMVAAYLDEREETTLKYFYNEGEMIRLQPAHPTMDPVYVSAEHCHIQGKVLSVIRQLK